MIAWLKAIHILSLSIWCAGLIALPFLLARRAAHEGLLLYRVQATTRFLFVSVVSPAAFIAIASGTSLIFARETFTMWFALKMLFVAGLAKLHVQTGTAVVEVFKDEGRYPPWRMVLGCAMASLLVCVILVVVLLKPASESLSLPTDIFRPGALGELVGFERQPSFETTMPTP